MYSALSRASRTAISRTSRVARAQMMGKLATSSSSSILANRFVPTQSRAFSAATDGLIDILKREYDEEKENETSTMPDELKDLYKTIQSRDWKIVEEGAMTRLFSTSGARKVQILFHCQDTVEDEVYDEEEEPVEYEEGEEPAPAFRFTVTVSKAGKTMVFVCLSKDARCTIESVNVTQTEVTQLDNGVPAAEYQGPEFFELAADLQDAFDGYLVDEVGIDEDMAAFISMYADYKEQTQYVEFLESAKNLLS